MSDAAHEWTDGRIEELSRKLERLYEQAASETHAKLKRELKEYARELEQREKALDNTKEAKAAHKAWLQDQAMRLDWLENLADSLSTDAMRANEKAVAALNDELPTIYSENANRAAYEVERAVGRDLTFTLVDEDTVRNLAMLDDGTSLVQEIPQPKVDRAKDYRWNRMQFTSAITQGILQGESIPNIVKRTDNIFGKNERAAYRTVRTAVTGAENAGRIMSYRRAERIGVELKQEWLATLDERTRHSHRQLDGERVAVGERFSNGPRYPGDPEGPAHEVWNCRCTLIAAVDGFETDDGERWSRLPAGLSYEDWKLGFNLTEAVDEAISEAKRNEETVSPVLKQIAEAHGLSFAGFDFRIKGSGSLRRKVLGDLKELSPEQAKRSYNRVVDGVHDNLRYTYLFDSETFLAQYNETVADLEASGYRMVRVKNTMANTQGRYKGVNTLVENDQGYVFELQFHTPESYDAKDRAHAFYEVERVAERGSTEWQEAKDRGAAIFNAVPVPAGASEIMTFDSLG